MNIARDLLSVLRKMKDCKVVHCNFNPKSVLIGSENNIQVINFLYGHVL